SLFTFQVSDSRLEGLAGVSVPVASIKLDGSKEAHEGPLLITHWGLSGPAVLRASAWGATLLHAASYRHGFTVKYRPDLSEHEASYRHGFTVKYRPDLSEQEVDAALRDAKESGARRLVLTSGPFALPQRLWRALALAAGAVEGTRWADASNALLAALTREVYA